MLAELAAFAVEDGVPAVAAADGIEAAGSSTEAALALGQRVRAGVLWFEVVHNDATEGGRPSGE